MNSWPISTTSSLHLQLTSNRLLAFLLFRLLLLFLQYQEPQNIYCREPHHTHTFEKSVCYCIFLNLVVDRFILFVCLFVYLLLLGSFTVLDACTCAKKVISNPLKTTTMMAARRCCYYINSYSTSSGFWGTMYACSRPT